MTETVIISTHELFHLISSPHPAEVGVREELSGHLAETKVNPSQGLNGKHVLQNQ